jgi:hypothetical protein
MTTVKIQKEISIPDSMLLGAESVVAMVDEATKAALVAYEQDTTLNKSRVTSSVRFPANTKAFIEVFGQHMGGMSNQDVIVMLVESFIRNSKNHAGGEQS